MILTAELLKFLAKFTDSVNCRGNFSARSEIDLIGVKLVLFTGGDYDGS
jgi:hypothetical protein